MRSHIVIILLVAIAATPLVNASWAGRGQIEPDTSLDRTEGWMWTNPDTTKGTTIGHKVYFNAFTIQNTAYSTHGVSNNENFATVGSEHPSWPGNMAALLGVWTDCNSDGYIGFGDNALFEYRSELLLDTSVCPASTAKLTHNDGKWVDEFVAIGGETQVVDQNPYDITDNSARVWADWGRPTDPPQLIKCNAGFPPEGTTHSTGGLLRTVDCFDSYSATKAFDIVADSNTQTAPYSFSDSPENQTQSKSQLNKPNPWGEQGTAPAATVWDCNSAPLVQRSNFVTTHQVSAPKVPPTLNTAGTAQSTTEAAVDGLIDCDPTNDVSGNQFSYQIANTPYSPDKAGVWDASGAKIMSDFPMAYNEGKRPTTTGSLLGARDSLDQGVRMQSSDGQWISSTRISEDKNPYTARANLLTLQNPIAPVQYVTAYAFVSPLAVSTYGLIVNPSANKVGIYGFEKCGGATFGIVNGWDCDSTHWVCSGAYDCTGPANGGTVDMSVNVGQQYNLRDVDCYDNSVTAARSLGVSYGILTGTSCV